MRKYTPATAELTLSERFSTIFRSPPSVIIVAKSHKSRVREGRKIHSCIAVLSSIVTLSIYVLTYPYARASCKVQLHCAILYSRELAPGIPVSAGLQLSVRFRRHGGPGGTHPCDKIHYMQAGMHAPRGLLSQTIGHRLYNSPQKI